MQEDSEKQSRKRARQQIWRAKNAAKIKAYAADYREKTREKRRDYAKRMRAENPERAKAIDAARYWANPGKENARVAAYRAANPDKIQAASAAYRRDNRDKTLAATSVWRAANPKTCRGHEHARRARKMASGGQLSPGLAGKLFKLQKGKCACCAQPLGDDYHMDHIMPLARGGSHDDRNIQLLRAICNHQKHAKDPIDFMRSRGKLL